MRVWHLADRTGVVVHLQEYVSWVVGERIQCNTYLLCAISILDERTKA
jgi:hypothetical protein